jgi:putative PIN family toxin of toxin-antitoxin system
MTRERVVIDTNVLISGLFSTTSTPALAVEKAVTKAQLVATRETLRELIGKLHSPRFDRYVRRERRDVLLERVASLVEIIDVLQSIRASRDPKDDKFLEAAVNGRADVIVTGDKDLLDLNPFRGVAIVTPAGYLARET